MGRDWNVSFLGSHVFKRVNKHERTEQSRAVLSFKSNGHIYSQTQLSLPYTCTLHNQHDHKERLCLLPFDFGPRSFDHALMGHKVEIFLPGAIMLHATDFCSPIDIMLCSFGNMMISPTRNKNFVSSHARKWEDHRSTAT